MLKWRMLKGFSRPDRWRYCAGLMPELWIVERHLVRIEPLNRAAAAAAAL